MAGPDAPNSALAAPAPTVIVERPPPGLARGKYPGPAWLVVLLAVLAVSIAGAFYVRRLVARRRG
ncbi:MAG: hypothetical protein DIU78_009595 [Pseudomonadota bacterium]|nr:MAG: hypothetical protein DIU78_16740 [Pseudomonadota bacterium]